LLKASTSALVRDNAPSWALNASFATGIDAYTAGDAYYVISDGTLTPGFSDDNKVDFQFAIYVKTP
jgi:hypothetical protein